jgi:WD40 repeat protein
MASLGRRVIGTFDLESGDQNGQFNVEQAPDPLVYSPDGERFAAAFDSNSVSVYDSGSGATLLSHHFADSPLDVAWHPSGHWIAIGDESGAVHLLDSRSGETRILGHHKAEAASVAFSPDGDYLISGGWERELICWDLRRMTRAFTIGWTVLPCNFPQTVSTALPLTTRK